MEIRYSALSREAGVLLEEHASRNTFWELPAGTVPDDPEFDKQMWIQSVLYRWGICGYTAFVGTGDSGSVERPAATAFFAPSAYFPGAAAMPSGPASSDAVLISTVFVDEPYMGLYLEHSLIETVLTEAERRGIRAVEAFGRNDSGEAADMYIPEGYHGWEERPDRAADALEVAPVLSADILEQEGFYVIGPHRRFPRYRKDLESRSNLFSAFGPDAHEMLNHRGPLSTVLGGGR